MLSGVFGDELDVLDEAATAVPQHPHAFHTYEKTLGGEIVHSRTGAALSDAHNLIEALHTPRQNIP